jgi:hypothetical protein
MMVLRKLRPFCEYFFSGLTDSESTAHFSSEFRPPSDCQIRRRDALSLSRGKDLSSIYMCQGVSMYVITCSKSVRVFMQEIPCIQNNTQCFKEQL